MSKAVAARRARVTGEGGAVAVASGGDRAVKKKGGAARGLAQC